MMLREWILIDAEGNFADLAMTARPSGPVMGNMQHSQGFRWIPVELYDQQQYEKQLFSRND